MKYYSYRPPRLIRDPQGTNFNHSRHPIRKFAPLVGIAALLGVGVFGFAQVSSPPRDLIRVVSKQQVLGSVASSVDSQDKGLVGIMVPFLTTEINEYRIQQNPIQALAVGGAATDLNAALELKAGMSVDFETGETFYSYNGQSRLPMASITKVMTAMVALDLASLDEQFTVSRSATEVEPTVMGAYEGEKLTTRELVNASLLMSANDAAQVLSEGIGNKYGGDSSLFIAAMNEKAKILGLQNTKFTNPQGYDNPEHYSTCEDLLVMGRYALTHYPDIARIVKDKDGRIEQNAYHQRFWLPNWNMLIGTYPGADGIKIGNTGDAKHTTLSSATREGKRIMTCVLGADGILKRDLAAAELLNIGFSKVGVAPYPVSEDLLRTRIKDWY